MTKNGHDKLLLLLIIVKYVEHDDELLAVSIIFFFFKCFVAEATNVVPILLSAVFLESDMLVEECLDFCHSHMNHILDSKQSFSCLTDQLIQKYRQKILNFKIKIKTNENN